MLTPIEKVAAIRAAIPPEGLFADKEWLISPEPFRIDATFAEELDKLGYRLQLFNRACNQLYRLSVAGKQPPWIAEYLDRGKPRELIELSRRREFRDDLPRVIRPDLILTESGPDRRSEPDGRYGYVIAELDNIPGGIGLTGWLGETYAALGHEILGGSRGMTDGFRRIAGDADILISQEAATYRPEMEWLARKLRIEESGPVRVVEAESYTPRFTEMAERGTSGGGSTGEQIHNPQSIYRFFEHFDLPNIPSAPAIMEAVASGAARITPPFKPYLEEKLWFALFWLRPLREYWRRELSERQFLKLQQVIPYTWILDPAPLPQHAVIPELNVHDWREVMVFSQKQRELILKISGFSEIGWGSRSVTLGSDASHAEWQAALERALGDFPHHPWILQRFHKGRLVEQPYFDATGAIATLRGRVRLCPYYFVSENHTHLGGALATIAPADKKLLHGMKDAIMVPTAVG